MEHLKGKDTSVCPDILTARQALYLYDNQSVSQSVGHPLRKLVSQSVIQFVS
jgi:hypothetical protein